jgi:membrane fusion protein (multidrug efflux system)
MKNSTRLGLYAVIALAVGVAGWWYSSGPTLVSTAGKPPAGGASAPASIPAPNSSQPAAGMSGMAGGAPQKPPVVEASKVLVGPMVREITAIGTLLSNESVIIRPEIAGRVLRISFEEGQRVKKGQLLVQLDDSTYMAELEQAKASLELSKANHERTVKLYSQGAATERSRDENLSKLRVDQARLEVARTNLEKSRLTAPFEGVLGLRKVSIGAYVTPGLDIVNLESIDLLKVDFSVPETALSFIAIGQQINVTADSFPGKSFSGEVFALDPRIDQNGRSVAVRAKLSSEGGLLRPGMFARVGLVTGRNDNAVMIPEEALIPRGAQLYVYKVVDGKVASQMVKVGLRREGRVEIVEGLKPDDVVVTAGHQKAREGAPVTLAGQAPQTAAPAPKPGG